MAEVTEKLNIQSDVERQTHDPGVRGGDWMDVKVWPERRSD